MHCVFCDIQNHRIIDQGILLLVIRDRFPVTFGHTLFIPRRHVKTWFELSDAEKSELNILLSKHKCLLEKTDTTISGFNIGMNCGEDAGQTVMHCHVHLIPRRKGDIQNPKGGVRGVIPEKQKY